MLSVSPISLDYLGAAFLSHAHIVRFRLLAARADSKLVAERSTLAAVLSWVPTLYCRWTTAAKETTVFCRERARNGGLDGGSGGLTPGESGNSSQTAKNPAVTPRWEWHDDKDYTLQLNEFAAVFDASVFFNHSKTWGHLQTQTTVTSFGSSVLFSPFLKWSSFRVFWQLQIHKLEGLNRCCSYVI